MKNCKVCGVKKDLDAFEVTRRVEDKVYYRNVCRPCRAEMKKEAYNKFVEKNGRGWGRDSYDDVYRIMRNVNRNGRRFPNYKPVSYEDIRDKLGMPEKCYLCGDSITDLSKAEVDHVMPLSKGGEHTIENLSWTHERCNQLKQGDTLPELYELLNKILNNWGS